MSRLEDRLFYRLEANLNHRDEVIEKYGHMIDVMRDYSFKNDITLQLAAALNIYRKAHNPSGEEITTADIGAYNLMHEPANISLYELTHGIKTFAFNIAISGVNWSNLKAKLGLPEWFGRAAFIPSQFTQFKFHPLFFAAFGLILGCSNNSHYNTFRHEALHTDKRLYSSNFHGLSLFHENPKYPAGLWGAKFQAVIADELFSFLYAETEKEALAEKLGSHYWQYYLGFIFKQCFSKIKKEGQPARQKDIKALLAPVKAQIKHAVNISFYLKTQLDTDILTPLFFALGPNEEEIKRGIFHGAFADLGAWDLLLNSGAAAPEKIRQQLQKRGYCRDSVIFSYLKR